MTNKTVLNELEKTLDCMQQQYPNQNLEIRMTKETFEKLETCNLSKGIKDTSYGMLGLCQGTAGVIVPDTYFPYGVSPDAVLVCPKCSEPTVSFESGGML